MASLPPIVAAAVGVGLGGVAATSGPSSAPAAAAALAAVGLLLGGLAAPTKSPAGPTDSAGPPGHALGPGVLRPLALGVLLGLGLSARAAVLDGDGPFARALPRSPARAALDGTVVAAEPPGPDGLVFLLDAEVVRDARGTRPVDVRVEAIVEAAGSPEGLPSLASGDSVRVEGLLEGLESPSNPGVYDARAAARRRGIDARLRIPDPRLVEIRTRGDGPGAAVGRARRALAARLDASFAPADAGLLRSLCLGDRGALASEDRRRFREAGAAHILAISGSHVALLAAGLLWCLRCLRAPPRVAAGIVLVATLLLVPFTGSAPPVVRSAAGFGLFLLGRLAGREPTGTVLLAIVAAGAAVIDPTIGADPGFRMSFAAAAGLLLVAPRLRRALVPERLLAPGGRPTRAPVRTAIAAGLAAWAASTPIAVAAIGQAGFVAVPVGLVAVPLAAAVLLGGAGAALLAPVPGLGPAAVAAVTSGLDLLRGFLDLPAALGCAAGPVEDPGWTWYALYGGAFLALARGSRRIATAAAWSLAVLLVALGARSPPSPPEGVRLTLLDVGHGQAALLETSDGRRALLDAGSRDRRDVGERIVLPALFALRASRLEFVAVSHADADHAGAVARTLADVDAEAIVVPPRFDADVRAALAATRVPVREAADGDVLLAGPWGRLVVLGPDAADRRRVSRNDSSLVLRLETPFGVVLLPGDREEVGVDRLLAAHDDLVADVLVLPHHGHPGLGLERLLRRTGAGVRVASAAAATVPRLPPATVATGRDGAIVVTLDSAGVRVETPFADRERGLREYDPGAPGMTDPTTLSTAAALLAAIGALSLRLRWLTKGGAVGAVSLGFAGVAAFGWPALAALLAPFLAATLAGRLPGGPPDEGPRTLRQVAANGLVPFAGALAGLSGTSGPLGGLALPVFLGGLAALGADTLATEFGTRHGGAPRSLLTGRRLAPFESGGVSLIGLLASCGGAALAPLAYIATADGLAAPGVRRSLAALTAAGVLAGLADSALGAALQRKGRCSTCGRTVEGTVCCGAPPTRLPRRLGWLDNDGVNLANGFVGAAAAVLLG